MSCRNTKNKEYYSYWYIYIRIYVFLWKKNGINPHFYSEAINKHIEVQVDTQHLYKEEKQHRLYYCTPQVRGGQGSPQTTSVAIFFKHMKPPVIAKLKHIYMTPLYKGGNVSHFKFVVFRLWFPPFPLLLNELNWSLLKAGDVRGRVVTECF